MDITSILGPTFSIGMLLVGMILEGGHLSSIIGGPAFIIVFGGTTGAVMVAYPLKDWIQAHKDIGKFLTNPPADPDQILNDIMELAEIARKESVLALEKKRDSIEFMPLKRAVKMAVDGTDPAIIRDALETEQSHVAEEEEVSVHYWEDMGAIAPTIGILGAVMGLMHVMENLDKPEMIGPGIATAFIATLYAVGGSNIFFIPMGKKLKRKSKINKATREMVIIGIDGILSGLNPAIIREKLLVFTTQTHEEG